MDQSEAYHIRKIQQLIKQTVTRLPLPEGVEEFETPKPEFQLQMREIDRQKRLENPDFQGAFHEKKFKPADKNKTKKSPGKKSPVSGNKPARKGKTFKKTYHKK